MRTSTRIGDVPPTRSNSRSCSTRSSLAWKAAEMSPISSRNSVPPWAISKRPLRMPTAPVKAPFSWPNSSVSSSDSVSAAQLTRTKGASLRGDRLCTARAMTSLPVPLSPRSSTVVLVGATWCTSEKTSCMRGELPMAVSS
ncbi:hypothetical protein GALL_554650 [mine drainage metagenome]|uniref:Uncharacterized protein n=1 Tax=mine drainage metagenome TaxID=410659 RepID=A0A1J5NXS4_9ZZZZ